MSAVMLPGWAADQPGHDREGGRRIAPDRNREGEAQATEEGLPPTPELEGRGRRYVMPRRRLGVFAYNTETGVVVTRVLPGTPASYVGLERGDRIVSVAGQQVGFVDERVYYLGEELQRRADSGGRVLLLVQNVRNSRLLNIEVWLDSRFGSRPAAWYGR
jgi:C-terminal processing protease CtpA/Prc